MKRVQKCFSIVLAVVLLLTAAPLTGFVGLEWPEITLSDLDFSFSADAAEIVKSGTCGTNVTYTLDSEGLLTISGTGKMTNYSYSYFVPWYYNRSAIKTVIIENGVTSIGNYAFYYCTSLTDITVDADNTTYCSEDGVLFNKSKSELIQYPVGNARTSYTIPDSVTSIGWNAFSGCTSLTTVIIGDSVTNIGDDAFSGCTSLTDITVDTDNTAYSSEDGVLFNKSKTELIQYPIGNARTSYTIPDSVTSIGYSAFASCTSLTSVIIGDSVTSIGSNAFAWCTSLTSVTIGNSVTQIGADAFEACTSLTDVYIFDLATWCNIKFIYYSQWQTETSYASNPLFPGDNLYLNGELLSDIVVPDGVTMLTSFVFSCEQLKTIRLPASVSYVAGNAFDYLIYSGSSLQEIYVDENNPTYCSVDGVLYTKDKTRLVLYPKGKQNLSFTIPDGVTTIDSFAFSDCTSLTSVTIPDSVTSIGEWAFDDCTSLTDVYYSGSEEQWAKISIGFDNAPLTNATIHYNSGDQYAMKIKGNNGATNSVAKGEEVTFYVYLLKNGEYVPCKNNYAFSFDNPGVFEAVSVGRNNDCFAVKLKAQNIGSTNMTISDDESGAKITIQLRSNMPLNAATFDDVKEQGTFYEHGSYHYWNYYYDYNGLYVNNFSYLKSDNNYYVNMNVFNEKAHYGAVVSYDKDGNVADYELINQMDKLPTSLWDGLFDSFDLTNAWLGKGLPGEYLFVNGTLAKETPIRDLKVPEGGYLVVSNNCVANEFVFLANVLDITIDCSLAISKIPCSETNEAAKNVIEDILNNFLPDALGKLSTDVITNLIKELSFNNIGDVLVELSKEFEKADIDLWKILKDSINAEFGFSLAEGIAFQMLGLDFIADIFGYTNTMIKMFDINCSQKAPQIAIYAPASSSTSRTSNGITVSSASSMNSSYVLHTYLLNDSSRKMSQAKPTIESISKNYEMYDISLYKKGEAAQPETEIEIFIPIPAGMNKNRVQVYWYKDDGTLESMNAEVRGNYAVFKTNHLSYYIICEQLAPMFVMGDVDNNGEIEAADARLALRAAVKLETLTEAQTKAADADKNGKLEAADARLILRAAVGLGTL